MEEFVSKRLDSNAIGFWDKVTKANVTTFASLSKKIKVRSAEEKEGAINADRSLFGRLLVIDRHHIDLREVPSYEMSSVPYALAHPDGSLRKTTIICHNYSGSHYIYTYTYIYIFFFFATILEDSGMYHVWRACAKAI